MLPPVYKIDAKGKIREWVIKVEGSTIIVEHGLKDGAKTKTEENISVGKNIGKKNETTKEEQAFLEAKSKWNNKKDSGYSESLESGEVNIKPMLANEFKKHKKRVIYPVFVQPKLDGYRMIYDGIKDKILSRTGKEFDIMYNTPLHKDLQKYRDYILDGELYLHDSPFQNLGIIRKKENKDKFLLEVEYHIYDIINERTFSEREKIMKENIKETKNIKLVKSYIAIDESSIDSFHKTFISEGYEGTMIRIDSCYSHNRTSNLLKYKDFEDEEFTVVGFTHEKDTKGDGLFCVVWVCITKNLKTFNVPSKGSREERDILYKNGEKYIGKQLSVQFFGRSEENIPRFPKTLRPGEASFRVKE